jgi:hypothetical protein
MFCIQFIFRYEIGGMVSRCTKAFEHGDALLPQREDGAPVEIGSNQPYHNLTTYDIPLIVPALTNPCDLDSLWVSSQTKSLRNGSLRIFPSNPFHFGKLASDILTGNWEVAWKSSILCENLSTAGHISSTSGLVQMLTQAFLIVCPCRRPYMDVKRPSPYPSVAVKGLLTKHYRR